MKECSIKKDGDTLVVKITCEIDHHLAKSIRETVDREIFGDIKILLLDFSSVTFMDSSGISLIIGRAAKAEKIGAIVVVEGLCGSLKRLVRMSGIEKIQNVRIK